MELIAHGFVYPSEGTLLLGPGRDHLKIECFYSYGVDVLPDPPFTKSFLDSYVKPPNPKALLRILKRIFCEERLKSSWPLQLFVDP